VRWLLLFVPACFSPSPPTGAPCATDRDCPPPQVCDLATTTCQLSKSPTDADADAPADAPTSGCWAAWKTGSPSLTAPRALTELNTSSREQDPTFSEDALTLYFTRSNTIFRATRPARDAAFDPPTMITELTSGFGESRISLTADGSHGVFASKRFDGEGLSDLWQTSLGAIGVFTTPTQVGIETLNDTNDQFDPELTPDGLGLYYSSFSGAGNIFFATRASIGSAFGAGIAILTDLAPGTSIFDPTLSPDGLVLVFGRFSGNGGANDLHFATRTSNSDPFVSHGLILAVDDNASQGDADLSSDGCSLVFGSDRAGGQGNRDLWISEIQTD
jgi:WD40-like Beta Propeller Repeat